MKIQLFSVDLKLIHADNAAMRSFQVLEFNDGLHSGFNGYNALQDAPDRKMISGRIRADYAALFPDMDVVDLNDNPVPPTGRPVLLIPRSDGTVHWLKRNELIAAQRMKGSYTMLNDDLHLGALSYNKGYQYYMAAKMAGPEETPTMFPKTIVIPTGYRQAAADIAAMGPSKDGYVIKPLSLYGGSGVRVIDKDKLDRSARSILSTALGKKLWLGLIEPSCIIQNRVAPNEVTTEKGIFDGTMRVAFTVYGEGSNMRCHVHDAYWKLPENPISADNDEKSVVSFSAANIEAKPKKTSAWEATGIKDIFMTYSESLDAGKDAPKKVISAPVDTMIKDWLFPSLTENMERYFGFVANSNHMDNVIELINHPSMGYQGVGWRMATIQEFYPSTSEDIDFHYPRVLMDAMLSSRMIRARGFMFEKIKAELEVLNRSVNCEDAEKEFSTPLRQGMKENYLYGLTSAVFNMSRSLKL